MLFLIRMEHPYGWTDIQADGLTSEKRQQNTSPTDPLAYFWGVRSCSLLLCLWECMLRTKTITTKFYKIKYDVNNLLLYLSPVLSLSIYLLYIANTKNNLRTFCFLSENLIRKKTLQQQYKYWNNYNNTINNWPFRSSFASFHCYCFVVVAL